MPPGGRPIRGRGQRQRGRPTPAGQQELPFMRSEARRPIPPAERLFRPARPQSISQIGVNMQEALRKMSDELDRVDDSRAIDRIKSRFDGQLRDLRDELAQVLGLSSPKGMPPTVSNESMAYEILSLTERFVDEQRIKGINVRTLYERNVRRGQEVQAAIAVLEAAKAKIRPRRRGR